MVDDFIKLILLSLFLFVFWLVLPNLLRRAHGISLKRQWQTFKGLNRRIGSAMMSVFEEEQRGRRERQVLDRHYNLCQTATGADRAYRIMTEARRADPGSSHWVSPKVLAETHTERQKAVLELRIFLGQLTADDADAIARQVADDCLYQMDGSMLCRFLLQESHAADDASDEEILSHYDRFKAEIDRLWQASCQDA